MNWYCWNDSCWDDTTSGVVSLGAINDATWNDVCWNDGPGPIPSIIQLNLDWSYKSSLGLTVNLDWSYAAFPVFELDWSYASPHITVPVVYSLDWSYISKLTLVVEEDWTYSDTFVQFELDWSYECIPPVVIEQDWTYRSIPVGIINVIQGTTPTIPITPGGGSPDPFNLIFPPQPGVGEYRRVAYQVIMDNNGTLMSLHDGTAHPQIFYISSFTFRRPRNQPCQWTMKIEDPMGLLSPYNTLSSWYDVLSTDIFSNTGHFEGFNIPVPWAITLPMLPPTVVLPGLPNIMPEIVKQITVKVMIWDGSFIGAPSLTFEFPNLCILSRRRVRTDKGMDLEISGTDTVGRYLNYRDLTLPTVMSGEFQLVNASNCADGSDAANASSVVPTSQLYTASEVISTILNILGVSHQSIYFDDFPIRRLDIQHEKALDIINKLLFINGGMWYSVGDTFVAVQPHANLVDATPDWTYVDNQNIFHLGETENALEVINRVTVGFPIDAVYGEGTVKGKGYGRFSCSINPPIDASKGPPYPLILCQGPGVFTEYDCFDINGRFCGHFTYQQLTTPIPFGVTPVTLSGVPSQFDNHVLSGSKISKIDFNYFPTGSIFYITPVNGASVTVAGSSILPTFIINSPEPRWAIKFVGLASNVQILNVGTPPAFGNFPLPAIAGSAQSAFEAAVATNNPWLMNNLLPPTQTGITVQNDASVARFGIMQTQSPIINAIIPNYYWAARVALQILLYSGRAKFELEFEVPPNPYMLPGDVVKITDSIYSLEDLYTVEEVEYIDNGTGPLTRFKAFKYQF